MHEYVAFVMTSRKYISQLKKYRNHSDKLTRFRSHIDRFDDPDERTRLRRIHGSRWPEVVFIDFIGNQPPKFPDDRNLLLQVLGGRRQFIEWVYGQDNPKLHAAKPRIDASKYMLTGWIMHWARSRFPWVKSKHIHAMAYRPESFGKSTSAPDEAAAWGPLYRRVRIPKKNGRTRSLDIPNPPLKRLQKATQIAIAPTAIESMPTCVMGLGSEGTIFHNAREHLGQHLIATHDIADFFPSTSISCILEGMRRLEDDGVPMLQDMPAWEKHSTVYD
ncbi:MAG: hypothetical protein MK100_09795, partial [Phycisphaerales bacterium]|nr:hypothetical protein [Phycisphaerales bacterium]